MKTISCTALALAVGGLTCVTAVAETTTTVRSTNPDTAIPSVSSTEAFTFPRELQSAPRTGDPRVARGSAFTLAEARAAVRSAEYEAARQTLEGDQYEFTFIAGPSRDRFGVPQDFPIFAIADTLVNTGGSFFTDGGSSSLDNNPDAVGISGADHEILESVSIDPFTGHTVITLTHVPEIGLALLQPGLTADFNDTPTPDDPSDDLEVNWSVQGWLVGEQSINTNDDNGTPDDPSDDFLVLGAIEESPYGDGSFLCVRSSGMDGEMGTEDDEPADNLDCIRLNTGLPTATTANVTNDRLIFTDGSSELIAEDRGLFWLLADSQIVADQAFNFPGTVILDVNDLVFDHNPNEPLDNSGVGTYAEEIGHNNPPAHHIINDQEGGVVFTEFFFGQNWTGIAATQSRFTIDPDVNSLDSGTGFCCTNGVETTTSRSSCESGGGTFYGFGVTAADDGVECVGGNPDVADLDDFQTNIINEIDSATGSGSGLSQLGESEQDNTDVAAATPFNSGCDLALDLAPADDPETPANEFEDFLAGFDGFTPYEAEVIAELGGTPFTAVAEEFGPFTGADATFEGTLGTIFDDNDEVQPNNDDDEFVIKVPASGVLTVSVTVEDPATVTLFAGDPDVDPADDEASSDSRLDSNVGSGCAALTEIGSVTVGLEDLGAGSFAGTFQANVEPDRFYYLEITHAVAVIGAEVVYGGELGDGDNPNDTNLGDSLGSEFEGFGFDTFNVGQVAYNITTSFDDTASIPAATGACIAADGTCTITLPEDCLTGLFEPGVSDCADSTEACFDPFSPSGIDEGETQVCDIATDFESEEFTDTLNGGDFTCSGGTLNRTTTVLAAGQTLNGETHLYGAFVDAGAELVDQMPAGLGSEDFRDGTGEIVDPANVLGEDNGLAEDEVGRLFTEVMFRDVDFIEYNHAGGDLVIDFDAQFPGSLDVLQFECDPEDPDTAVVTLNADVDDNGNIVEDAQSFVLGEGFDDCSMNTFTGVDFAPGTYFIRVSNDFAEDTRCTPPAGVDDIPVAGDQVGDANEDGGVFANDLLTVLNNFGINDGTAARADGDVAVNPDTGEIGDGNVVANDLLAVLNNFGTQQTSVNRSPLRYALTVNSVN